MVLVSDGGIGRRTRPVDCSAAPLSVVRTRAVALPRTVDCTPGTTVVLGVRPQGLPLAGAGAAATLTMRVKVAEYLGTETVLTGVLSGSGESVISSVNGDHSDLAGGEVGLAIDAQHLHVFDKASQINLVR